MESFDFKAPLAPTRGERAVRWLYVAVADLSCWVCWLLVVWSVLVLLGNVRKHVGFWRLVFIVFSLIAVTFAMDIVISGVQKLSFGRPSLHLPTLGVVLSA